MSKQGFMDFFSPEDPEKEKEESAGDESTEENEETFTPSVGLFDFLKDITMHKRGDLLDANTEKEFSKFMILRFLACDPELMDYVEAVEPYQDVLSKDQLYELLIALIPQKKRYLKYRIGKNSQPSDEAVDKVVERFEISRDDAYKYVQLMGYQKKEQFLQSFGGEVN